MTEPLTITEPGVYALPFEDYLADPVPGGSLSASGAKTLLSTCPAVYAWQREHGRPDSDAFDLGHAAHHAVLGDGMPIIPVDAPDWRTKAAREAKEEARAAGGVPLLREQYDQVQAMADALREHPIAGKILHPDRGTAEQSLFWLDDEIGVWRRARLDALPHPAVGRMIYADYKTTRSAKPSDCAAAIARYGYHQQIDWYSAGIVALGLAEDAAGLLVFQETTPPYLVTVVEPSATALRIGRERNRKALEIFKRCTETNHWPGYADGIELIDLPLWAERAHEMELAS